MKTFKFKAKDKNGTMQQGVLRAETDQQAADHFKSKGMTLLSLTEQKSLFGSLSAGGGKGRGIKPKEIMIFTRQMYALTVAGLPLVNCLKSLVNSSKNKNMRAMIDGVKKEIESGTSFSGALGNYEKCFDSVYCSIIKAGEASGALPEVLQRLSTMLEKDQETKSKIKQAMSYPIIVIGVIVVAMLAVGFFVLPKFTKIFASFGDDVQLPIFTRILMSSNELLRSYWWLWGISFIALSFVFRFFVNSSFGRPIWDAIVLRVPVMGQLFLKISMSRFARTVATLVKSGVPIVETLELSSKTASNVILCRSMNRIKDKVREGKPIATSMSDESIFPDMIVQMVSAGEEAGRIDELMEMVGDFYDSETDIVIKNLTTMLEPILLLFIAGIVLVLALGIFLPLWNLSSSV